MARATRSSTSRAEVPLAPLSPDPTLQSPPTTKKRKRDTHTIDLKVEQSASKDKITKKGPVKRKSKEENLESNPVAEEISPPKKKGRRKKAIDPLAEQDHQSQDSPEAKSSKKRKTKEENIADIMPLAARTIGHSLTIGAHVSAAGGVHNAVLNSVHIGANAFALFLKSQRKWTNPDLTDEHSTAFHSNCTTHSYDQATSVVPHGSYLVNLAHTNPDRTTQAYDVFLNDLRRCERLGIKLYNFHPGNVASTPRPVAIAHLASNLNRAHAATSSVVTLLENMAAKGSNTLGSTFEDLADIIALVKDKTRIGICLDTCHAFAAGYDLRNQSALEATLSELDRVVGLRYLKALHVNDSKAPFDSRRDLHANIGTGFLGLRAFHALVNDPRMAGLPLILETPIEVLDADGVPVKEGDGDKAKVKEDKTIWATEIKLLESLVGMSVDTPEFLVLEAALARQGAPERARLLDQVERKKGNDAKKQEQVANKEAKRKEHIDRVFARVV